VGRITTGRERPTTTAFPTTSSLEVAATLIPPSSSPFERLLLAGQVRPAAGAVDFRALPRISQASGTAEILTGLRGDR
jgi:hypothetical protein